MRKRDRLRKGSHLHLYPHAGGEIEVGEFINRFGSGFFDIDQSFVRQNFKRLAGTLIDVGRTNYSKNLPFCREWNRAYNFGAGANRRIDNLLRASVNYPSVVSF